MGSRRGVEWARRNASERAPILIADPAASRARMVWEPLSGNVTWTEPLYRMHGLRHGQDAVSFETFIERAHPDERDALASLLSERMRTLEPFAVRHRIVRSDGAVRLVEIRGRFDADRFGNLARFELEATYAD